VVEGWKDCCRCTNLIFQRQQRREEDIHHRAQVCSEKPCRGKIATYRSAGMHLARDVEVTTCEPHVGALIPIVLLRLSVEQSFTSGNDEERQSFARQSRLIEALKAENKVCRTMLLGCDNHGGDWWSVVKSALSDGVESATL
jgi:hypothetical protein